MAVAGNDPDAVDCYIYDYIGYYGVSAKSFVNELSQFKNAKTINLHINSPGGEVYDGLAIYNYLNRHAATVNVTIDGIAASIASVIAMAGDKIKIPENAFFMVHNPWSVTVGDAKDMDAASDLLAKMNDSLAGIYAGRTKMDPAECRKLMDAETYLMGAEAVEKGFADEIEKPVEMYASFDVSKTGLPKDLQAALLKGQGTMKDEPSKPKVDAKPDLPSAGAPDAADGRAEFKKFSDAFGAEAAGRYFAKGLTFEAAVAEFRKESDAAVAQANKDRDDAKAGKVGAAKFDPENDAPAAPKSDVSDKTIKLVMGKVHCRDPKRAERIKAGIEQERKQHREFLGENEDDED